MDMVVVDDLPRRPRFKPHLLDAPLRRLSTLSLLGLARPAVAGAQSPLQLRMGTVAPKNSLYHRELLKLSEAWRAACALASCRAR